MADQGPPEITGSKSVICGDDFEKVEGGRVCTYVLFIIIIIFGRVESQLHQGPLLQLMGSAVVVCTGLVDLRGMWGLGSPHPGPGLNPHPLCWKADSQPLAIRSPYVSTLLQALYLHSSPFVAPALLYFLNPSFTIQYLLTSILLMPVSWRIPTNP